MAKHLKFLGIVKNSAQLKDPKKVKALLDGLVKVVGMQILGKPTTVNVPLAIEKLGRKPFEDEGGATAQLVAYVTLSTSHIAIHTWPLRNEFHLDLYSCRHFEASKVLRYLHKTLQIARLKTTDCTRGCEW